MAVKQNFVVQSGLEVADSAVITGVFKASGLTYPTADGNNNEVIKTNGSGSLSFGTLRIRDLSDVDLSTLEEEGMLLFDSATNTFQARNEIVGADINSDGGFY
tara:strand:- start:168 stop:476 length:309 start_codon:yes stop_codon:yes gene_type:complete